MKRSAGWTWLTVMALNYLYRGLGSRTNWSLLGLPEPSEAQRATLERISGQVSLFVKEGGTFDIIPSINENKGHYESVIVGSTSRYLHCTCIVS